MGNFQNELFNPVEAMLFRGASRLGVRENFYRWYQRLKPSLEDIARFKDIHRGKRCFILGGGPSLKQLDPTPLRNEFTFGVNSIFLIYDWLGFEPTYYTVEDRLVYEDRFDDIREQVSKSTCFFPQQFARPEFDRDNHHYLRAIYEFNNRPDWPHFSTDASKVVWIGGTVVYVCLQLAFYMGFESVYLLGIDLNYVKPDDIQEKGSEWTSQGQDPNHFHPDYFGKGYRWHNPRPERMERAFAKAGAAFEAHGRVVYNATLGGKLEVYERVAYDSLFAS